MPSDADPLHHHLRPMDGRDPHEAHRVSTPLEPCSTSPSQPASASRPPQFAHLIAEGHYDAGLLGFGFASFAICWAWINFSWFSSAYDTDDWIFRLVTMVQMIGVLILAIGLPRMFASLGHGDPLDNSMMVLGYVDHARRHGVRNGCARPGRIPARRAPASPTPRHLDRAGGLGGGNLSRRSRLLSSSSPRSGCADRIHRPLSRRKNRRRHALARAPYRRALQPLRHHRSRRERRRHRRDALGRGEEPGLDASMPRSSPFAGVGLTFGIWWIYYVLPSGPVAARASRALASSGATVRC